MGSILSTPREGSGPSGFEVALQTLSRPQAALPGPRMPQNRFWGHCPLCGCYIGEPKTNQRPVRGQWKDRMAYHLRCHEVADARRADLPVPPRSFVPEVH